MPVMMLRQWKEEVKTILSTLYRDRMRLSRFCYPAAELYSTSRTMIISSASGFGYRSAP